MSVLVRTYVPRRTANRLVAYNKHLIQPKLELPSRVAWYLAYEAEQRRVYVADLITTILVEVADTALGDMSVVDRQLYEQSIPYHRGPYKQA